MDYQSRLKVTIFPVFAFKVTIFGQSYLVFEFKVIIFLADSMSKSIESDKFTQYLHLN